MQKAFKEWLVKSAANPFAATIGSIVRRIARKPVAARTVVENNILNNFIQHLRMGGSAADTMLAPGIYGGSAAQTVSTAVKPSAKAVAPGIYSSVAPKAEAGVKGMRKALQTQAQFAKQKAQRMRSGLGRYDPTTGQRVPI